MSIKRQSISWAVAIVLLLCAQASAGDPSSLDTDTGFPSAGRHLVLLLDINPRQKKVLDVERALAEGLVEKLNQPGNVFSVITFGYGPPVVVKSKAQASEAIDAIRTLTTEELQKGFSSIRLYDSVRVALDELGDVELRKSLLIVSEGNNYFPGKTFKETVARAQQLHVNVNVAMVTDHTLYETKGVQRYGFDLRRLAGKTRGQYVEVGSKEKKVPPSVDRLSESILAQDRRN